MPLNNTSNVSSLQNDLDILTDYEALRSGVVRFVDSAAADDSGDGKTPETAKKTIIATIAVCGIGDTMRIKAGTYDETDIDFNILGLRIECELGVVINDTVVGTQTVLLSGMFMTFINGSISQAGQINLSVTGSGCRVFDTTCSFGTNTFDVSTTGVRFFSCNARRPATIGFHCSSSGFQGKNCNTFGVGATKGYYFSAGSANALENCRSKGHTTAGYDMSAATKVTILNCSSGGGDGKWVLGDTTNVWQNFNFDSLVLKEITLDIGGGGGDSTYNLFKVTGNIKITRIDGVVITALTGTNTDCHLDIYSVNSDDNLSKNTTLDIGAAIEGSLLARIDKADKVLAFAEPAGPYVLDQIDSKKEGFRVGEDRTGGVHVDTYIRFHHTGAAECTGVLSWHIEWEPISDDGLLQAA